MTLAAPEIGIVESELRRAISALPVKYGAVWNVVHSGGSFVDAGHLIGLSAGRCAQLYREADWRIRRALADATGEERVSLEAVGAERDHDLIASARPDGWTEAPPKSEEWREAARQKSRESYARAKERRDREAEWRWKPPRSCSEMAMEVLPGVDWSRYEQLDRRASSHELNIWWDKSGITLHEHSYRSARSSVKVQDWSEVPAAAARLLTEVCDQNVAAEEEAIMGHKDKIARLRRDLAKSLSTVQGVR